MVSVAGVDRRGDPRRVSRSGRLAAAEPAISTESRAGAPIPESPFRVQRICQSIAEAAPSQRRHLDFDKAREAARQDWIARDGSVSTAARKGCRVPQGATRTSPRGRNAGIRPVRRIAPAALERQNVSRVHHLLFGAPRGARTGTKPMNGGFFVGGAASGGAPNERASGAAPFATII